MEDEILKWKQIWWTRLALRHSMPRPCPHWTIQCNFRATLIKVKSPYVVHLNLPFIGWGVQDQIETILIKEFFTKESTSLYCLTTWFFWHLKFSEFLFYAKVFIVSLITNLFLKQSRLKNSWQKNLCYMKSKSIQWLTCLFV